MDAQEAIKNYIKNEHNAFYNDVLLAMVEHCLSEEKSFKEEMIHLVLAYLAEQGVEYIPPEGLVEELRKAGYKV